MAAKQDDPCGLVAVADNHYRSDAHYVSWAERLRRRRRARRQAQAQHAAADQDDDGQPEPRDAHGSASEGEHAEDPFAPEDAATSHSSVRGVTPIELDAAVAHLLRGHSVPVAKCREMLYSHLLHACVLTVAVFVRRQADRPTADSFAQTRPFRCLCVCVYCQQPACLPPTCLRACWLQWGCSSHMFLRRRSRRTDQQKPPLCWPCLPQVSRAASGIRRGRRRHVLPHGRYHGCCYGQRRAQRRRWR